MGIEPTSEAWEASILPLYDARSERNQTQNSIAARASAIWHGRIRLFPNRSWPCDAVCRLRDRVGGQSRDKK